MIEALQLKTLAELLEEQGDYANAEPLFRKALAIKESLFGSESENLSEDLFNLGMLCCALDKRVDAENFLMRAWSIERRYKGTFHPDTLHTLDVLNDLYYSVDKTEQQAKFPCGFKRHGDAGMPRYH